MKTSNKDIQQQFDQLVREVKNCEKCPRMCNSERVLGPASGSLTAKLVFVGEAPGRLGADESQIPFHGDKSGHNFETLLEQVGLNRYELFVTNAVLCNPKDEKGNNATPTPQEVRNCSAFLQRQIELIQPSVVVTLGSTALKASSLIEAHHLSLREHVRSSHKWLNRLLIPAYHPGQRAMIHRSFANQLSDYQFIAEETKRIGTVKWKKSSSPKGSKKTKNLVDSITSHKNELSYFALHKLYFMIEVRALEELGERLTDSYIIRQKDGPYCVELHPKKLASMNLNLSTYTKSGKLFIKRLSPQLFDEQLELLPSFSQRQLALIKDTLNKYGDLSDPELKRVAYSTTVMRTVLRLEKSKGLNLFNAPLIVPKAYE